MSKRSRPASPCSPTKCSHLLGGPLSPGFFKALGDPNRLALLARLVDCREPCTVGEASCCCAVDLSVVSRHLAILREAGIVESERRGKEVHYSVRHDVIVQTLRQIADTIEACCSPLQTEQQGARKWTKKPRN